MNWNMVNFELGPCYQVAISIISKLEKRVWPRELTNWIELSTMKENELKKIELWNE
jgi:hypothetical protein